MVYTFSGASVGSYGQGWYLPIMDAANVVERERGELYAFFREVTAEFGGQSRDGVYCQPLRSRYHDRPDF